MAWLGSEDAAAAVYVESLLGTLAPREVVRIWSVPPTAGNNLVQEDDDWVAIVNEVARQTPGTLAHGALSDPRIPERFHRVAPTFEALGWRHIDAGAASTELARALAFSLMGERELRDYDEAMAAASGFVALFGVTGQFLTNLPALDDSTQRVNNTGSWTTACPLTPAVAEAGVVGAGGGKVGIFWVMER